MEVKKFDFIVIGSGIAGLRAALELSHSGSVMVVTKGSIKESATQWAQGGIAAALHHDDTPKLHLQDTLNAGVRLCNEDAVQILVDEGPECVNELIQLGAKFDQQKGQFHYTKEAAHGHRRILHAKDNTGKEINKVLGQRLLNQDNISFFDYTMVSQLLMNQQQECMGAVMLKNGASFAVHARATLLATGGCAQVFSKTTTPVVATGDGIALAYNVGCVVQDMEFIQFHPTTLSMGDKRPISIFLISEAVRGEGAVLRNIFGKRFMLDYHVDAELAPRDIVARSIYLETQKTKNHVFLDLSPIQGDIVSRFPTIYRRCLESGIDITRDFIPVSPAAHYCMGGIQTSVWGETVVSRLFAAGEVASLGVHGANRLASNSLLDGLVFGRRAAIKMKTMGELSDFTLNQPILTRQLMTADSKMQFLSAKQTIRSTMWRYVSIIRCADELSNALITLNQLKWLLEYYPLEPELIEVQYLLINALLITQAAYDRQESRGAHYRSDFLESKSDYERHLIFSKV